MRRDKALKYFQLAKYQAELFSKDPSTKVGCIILAPDSLQVLSCGYNGFPRNINETDKSRWERPIKLKWCEHSERNALYNACRSGTKLEGSVAVITMYPCCDCARGLIQSGIKTIVTETPDFEHTRWGDDFKISKEMFEEAGIHMILLTEQEKASVASHITEVFNKN